MNVQVLASVARCDPLAERALVRDHCGLVGVAITEGDRPPVGTDLQGVAEDPRFAPGGHLDLFRIHQGTLWAIP